MRIIAGKHRGLKLNTFDFEGTRPTADKVREAIFSKIQFKIPNSNCLDLFGGTGAITIELLSRGANMATICDNNLSSINLIKQNAIKAKENPIIVKNDYLVCLKKLKEQDLKFDIIFLDPPFKSGFGKIAIDTIYEYQLLNENGILIYECDKTTNINLNNFKVIDERVYGTIKVYFLVNNN